MFYDHSVIYHFCLLNQLTHVLYTVEKKDIGIAVLNRENIATSLSATHANIKTTLKIKNTKNPGKPDELVKKQTQ